MKNKWFVKLTAILEIFAIFLQTTESDRGDSFSLEENNDVVKPGPILENYTYDGAEYLAVFCDAC